MALTYQEVADILKVIDASECDELILEIEGARLVVRRSASNRTDHAHTAPPLTAPVDPKPPALSPASSTPTSARSTPAAAEPSCLDVLEVRAPMVGTFYRRPSPQEPPFVEVGQEVVKGQPLCLIEVMKLFASVEASGGGTIEAVLAEDGALVEFDQLLFRISCA